MTTPFPTLSLDPNGYWEFSLPALSLPGEVARLVLSDDGVYVEFITGRYDLVTWDDIVSIAIPGRSEATQQDA